jgi:hypothetical protein
MRPARVFAKPRIAKRPGLYPRHAPPNATPERCGVALVALGDLRQDVGRLVGGGAMRFNAT